MANVAVSHFSLGPAAHQSPYNQKLGVAEGSRSSSPRGFDVIAAYRRALEDDQVPHPIAAILALVTLMEASTASTVTGLATELMHGRQRLIDTQHSLGVRAGCQLWERFVAVSGGGGEDFPAYKRTLISQGRAFCSVTAPQCREKIAQLAVDFLRDDCTILTHSYSRTVISTILRAHKQNKRVKVYVAEAKPNCWGMKTHQILTAQGIPCIVVLDSAVAYIMDRVDLVLVGTEAVVESGGLVSSVGTYQVALVAKAMQKPFYALAESYKFLRHYPLSQTDIPMPKPLNPAQRSVAPLTFANNAPYAGTSSGLGLDWTPEVPPTPLEPDGESRAADDATPKKGKANMTQEMIDLNPMVDMTTPDLIDFIITDLGAPLSPTSVSQYLVAQFSS